MEKIKTFTFLLALLTAVCATGQTLSFKFDAPRIIYVNPNNFLEFDVLVESSSDSENFYSGSLELNFDNTSLSGTGVQVTKGVLINGVNTDDAPKYNLTTGVTGSKLTIEIVGDNVSFNRNPTDEDDWNKITTNADILITVRFQINGYTTGQVAGISFDEVATSNGFWQYMAIVPHATAIPYDRPSFTYTNNLSDVYLGRIHAAGVDLSGGLIPGWSQAGGLFNTAALYTSIWSGTGTGFFEVPAQSKDIRIHNGATLNIPVASGGFQTGGQWNAETVEINGSLTIQSSAVGTGSLIADAITGTGTVSASRHMTGNKWHLISGTASQSVESFLAANGNIPTKDFLGTDRRGMMEYNTTVNGWSDFFLDASQPGTMTTGKGFAARTSSDGNVTFTGSIVAGNINVPIVDDGQGWNLIGNPYTSAIDLNNNANNFLAQNTAQLDPSYVAVYVWEETETTSQYKISNLTDSNVPDTLAIAQGFFVKSKAGGGTIQFNRLMQFHSPFVKLKSGTQQAGLKLIATNNNGSSSTDVMFLQNGTPGLDPGYDAGALKLDRNFAMYTRLVEDNGVDFAIQSLPRNGFEKYVVPVGLDFKEGGQVAFTAQLLSLPSSINVVLEDRLNNVFTPLNSDDSRYTAIVAANASSTGRFYLHVSYSTTGIEDELNTNPINAYMMRNEIIIDGKVSSNAIATLYDLQGRSVLSRNLEQGLRNRIMSQGLKTGVYLLQIVDNGQRVSFKLPVVE